MEKRMLAALLAVCALCTSALALEPPEEGPAPVLTYEDVSGGAWYASAVDYVTAHELMPVDGVLMARVYFSPERAITRQEAADAVYCDAQARGAQQTGDDAGTALREMADYADIGQSFRPAMGFCYDAGVLRGDNARRLYPDEPITREEMAAVMQRYYAYLTSASLEQFSGMAVREFTDEAALQDWTRQSVRFCVAAGVMNGNADGSFNPKGSVTRAEMAQLLYNLEQGFAQTAPEGVKRITA